MLNSYLTYLLTTLKSNFIRKEIPRIGFEKVAEKYSSYGGYNLLGPDEISEHIYEGIMSGFPFMVGRFGSIELMTVAKELFLINYHKEQDLDVLCNNAGFFPNSLDLLDEFKCQMLDSMKMSDIQGIWYLPFEDYFLSSSYLSPKYVCEGRYLEPWFSNKPWTRALKGKKVLVIHPFVNTIRTQYERRQLLFDNDLYLPEFKLVTLKSVQTIAGTKDDRFETWFDALQYMYNESIKIDFDIAIIGCGAYGYPLAAKLKKFGKQAIHLGGVTQILFGIKGKRWDNNPLGQKLYNEFWVRPNEEDIPLHSERVENACYW